MYLDHKTAAFSNPPLAQIYPHQRVVENTLNQAPHLVRNLGPDELSPTEKVNILPAISQKRIAAKHGHKEPALRAASWTLSSGEGDGCVWFNFS